MKTTPLFPIWFALGFLAVFAGSHALAQDWARAKLEQSPRHLEWKTLKQDGRELACFVGYPEVNHKATAVVVIHDIWGMSHWARSMVDDLAAAGYIAVAPDLLWGAGPGKGGTAEFANDAIPLAIRALSADQITADVSAAVRYAATLPSCNGKVAVVGFCWGGSESFRFATNTSAIKAAFVFYGDGPTRDADLERIVCPVIAYYAENDMRINATVPVTTDQMKRLGKIYRPEFYPGSGHGFMKAGQAPAPASDADVQAQERYVANKAARNAAWSRLLSTLRSL
ncbi:MAG: dienelactone hydrolase family protein [Opitutaceae bacterium]|nr:dienelactone hydrolase family protein [Opitutaceae bacterium]